MVECGKGADRIFGTFLFEVCVVLQSFSSDFLCVFGQKATVPSARDKGLAPGQEGEERPVPTKNVNCGQAFLILYKEKGGTKQRLEKLQRR